MLKQAPPKAPPFCPNPSCPFHRGDLKLWRYARTGCFRAGQRRVSGQRYKCCKCGRSFSDRTFLAGYWLKRPQLLRHIAARLVGCSGYRQIARELGVSPQTVARHAARLGRQALLFHVRMLRRKAPSEPLALDSFVSFHWSQYFPSHYHLLVGRESHFVWGFTESEVRRSGRMTSGQERRRAELERKLGRPDPRSIEKEVAAVIEATIPRSTPIDLTTDEHDDYPRALRRLGREEITHQTVSSRDARTPHNPLFAVNLLDLLIRHSSANHKRETIAYSRSRRSAIERLWLLVVWRNYAKSFSEKFQDATPAQRAGITSQRWTLKQLFRRRIFPDRVRIPARWKRDYDGSIVTRVCAASSIRPLRFAY